MKRILFFSLLISSFAYAQTGQAYLQVPTMSALYAFTSGLTDGAKINLQGFYAANDGGGGLFYWSGSSTATCDSGTIIKATSITTGRFIRVYPAGSVNASWFGVIPNGSRILTSALQNAINKTGHVIVNRFSSNIILNNSLSIPSNTWLDVDPATTLFLQDSSNTILIHNATIDSSGITDHDFTITGGIWDGNWLGNPGTNGITAIYKILKYDRSTTIRGLGFGSFEFDGVQNVTVKNVTIKNALLSSIHINHFSNIEAGPIRFVRDQPTISDGVHLSGPGNNFYIHDLTGKTGDDAVALGAWEWWIASAGSQHGDIKNGKIERVNMDSTVWTLVKMYGGTTAWLRNININDVSGISYNSAFYWGTDADVVYATNVPGIGTLDHVTMSNVAAATVNTQTVGGFGTFGPVLHINCNVTDLVVDKIRMDSIYSPNFSATQPWFSFLTGNTAKSITISNFSQNMSLPWTAFFKLDGTISKFNLINPSILSGLASASITGTGAASVNIIGGDKNYTGYNTSNSTAAFGSIEVQPYALNNATIGDNTYYNGSNQVYRATGTANLIHVVGGDIYIQSAASGSAGATATFNTNARFFNNGNTQFGTAGPTYTLSTNTFDFPNNTTKYGLGVGTFLFQSYALNNCFIFDNAYFDGSNIVTKATGTVGGMQIASGNIYFKIAPSTSAGGSVTGVLKFPLTLFGGGNSTFNNTTDNSTAQVQTTSTTQPQTADHYDATHYTTRQTNSSGNETIIPSGGTETISANLTLPVSKVLTITEGSNGRVGQVALVNGTKAITITGLTTLSRAFLGLAASGGTAGTRYVMACTANTLTITAVDASGATVTTDTSTINYFIIN